MRPAEFWTSQRQTIIARTIAVMPKALEAKVGYDMVAFMVSGFSTTFTVRWFVFKGNLKPNPKIFLTMRTETESTDFSDIVSRAVSTMIGKTKKITK